MSSSTSRPLSQRKWPTAAIWTDNQCCYVKPGLVVGVPTLWERPPTDACLCLGSWPATLFMDEHTLTSALKETNPHVPVFLLPNNLMTTNSTTTIVSWAPNPDGRGTIDLLWTSFATVFLCTWSAIHPNLPSLGEKENMTFIRRMLYVVSCIIAPEFFAYIALDDLSAAMQLKEQV